MIRELISKIRLLVLGPVLNRFSRLTPGQIETLMLLASDESTTKHGIARTELACPTDNLATNQVNVEIQALKSTVAELRERIDVLERIYTNEK